MNLLIVLSVVGVMVVLYFIRVGMLVWMVAWWAAVYVIISHAINPPIPASIIGMFMAIVTISLLAYISSDDEKLEAVKGPLTRFLVDKKYTTPLVVVMIALPAVAAVRVYQKMNVPVEPPVFGRTIHPAPPQEITFKGRKINLVTDDNPYRELAESEPEEFKEHVENGLRVYYENCVFCHGDTMEGDGIYAYGLDPIPANFADSTTIAMLQEAYLFWRIAKGGPGLPEESGPWSSAMPAWELFLSEEEIWDVILFLYDFTDQKPRAKEHIE